MWDSEVFPDFPGYNPQFLYCVSKYPTEFSDLIFDKIDFTKYDGFSDHTIGITAPILAMSRGAKIIEKHFTLDKTMYGPDHACSMTPDELTSICKYAEEFQKCL
jgi:sialic acid synthase SpsE